jgi:hypothetical protein
MPDKFLFESIVNNNIFRFTMKYSHCFRCWCIEWGRRMTSHYCHRFCLQYQRALSFDLTDAKGKDWWDIWNWSNWFSPMVIPSIISSYHPTYVSNVCGKSVWRTQKPRWNVTHVMIKFSSHQKRWKQAIIRIFWDEFTETIFSQAIISKMHSNLVLVEKLAWILRRSIREPPSSVTCERLSQPSILQTTHFLDFCVNCYI